MSQAGILDILGNFPFLPREFVTDAGTAIAIANVINFLGDSAQGLTSSGSGNTVTYTIADATTAQKGVIELSTEAETLAGAALTVAVVPSGLAAKLGTQTEFGIPFGGGATAAISWTAPLGAGKVLLGSALSGPVEGTLKSTRDLNVDVGATDIDFTLLDNVHDVAIHPWNGAIIEDPSISVDSDGATITLSLEKSGGGNLTLVFESGFVTFNSSPATTITLTAGTDPSPQLNFIYIPSSTNLLTVDSTSFPTTEHVPIATVLCQSAASLQTQGAYKVHQWSDHISSPNNQGHISHLNKWIREQNATWENGVSPTLTITANGGAADNVIFTSASGNILQLHTHSFPEFTGTPTLYTVNDPVTDYAMITDLNSLLTDSTGGSMSGRRFSLVIWGVVNEDETDCKLMVNLPSGTYGNNNALLRDNNKYADFSIPSEFTGTGFLIAQLNLRHQTAASGTWTLVSLVDLRGFFPGIEAGGQNAQSTEFIDSTFRVLDDGDNTSEIAFEAGSISTGTTRTLTVQDADGTIAYTNVAGGGTGATTLTGVLTGNGTGAITANAVTQFGTVIAGASNAVSSVAPSATSGVPYISQGAAANPIFGTVEIAGGGTGATTAAAARTALGTAPTVQIFTTGSGTYTTPANVLYLKVRMVGGGGGGGGSADDSSGGTGGTGGATTFGTALLTCPGGFGGINAAAGGSSNTATVAAPAYGVAKFGAGGGGAGLQSAAATPIHFAGGAGGASPFGGSGPGNGILAGLAGIPAKVNSGSGGSGGVSPNFNGESGGGGGSGAYIDAIIPDTLDATYAYAIGAAGTAGTAGTAGGAGGAGGTGYIIVEEYYI